MYWQSSFWCFLFTSDLERPKGQRLAYTHLWSCKLLVLHFQLFGGFMNGSGCEFTNSVKNPSLVPSKISLFDLDTLYNVILRIARNLLENKEDIKYLTQPFYHTNLDWFSLEWSKKKFFWRKKKFKMADSKKLSFSTTPKSWAIVAKISQIGPWVTRVDWCKGTQPIWLWGCLT